MLVRDVEGRGKVDVQVVESSTYVTGSLGAVWRGIDHLGCSGLLGRFVEGGVLGRGLHVIGPDLRRQAPPFDVLQKSALSLGSLLPSFSPVVMASYDIHDILILISE